MLLEGRRMRAELEQSAAKVFACSIAGFAVQLSSTALALFRIYFVPCVDKLNGNPLPVKVHSTNLAKSGLLGCYEIQDLKPLLKNQYCKVFRGVTEAQYDEINQVLDLNQFEYQGDCKEIEKLKRAMEDYCVEIYPAFFCFKRSKKYGDGVCSFSNDTMLPPQAVDSHLSLCTSSNVLYYDDESTFFRVTNPGIVSSYQYTDECIPNVGVNVLKAKSGFSDIDNDARVNYMGVVHSNFTLDSIANGNWAQGKPYIALQTEGSTISICSTTFTDPDHLSKLEQISEVALQVEAVTEASNVKLNYERVCYETLPEVRTAVCVLVVVHVICLLSLLASFFLCGSLSCRAKDNKKDDEVPADEDQHGFGEIVKIANKRSVCGLYALTTLAGFILVVITLVTVSLNATADPSTVMSFIIPVASLLFYLFQFYELLCHSTCCRSNGAGNTTPEADELA